MYQPIISVRKLTDEELMRTACEMTFNGTSKQSLTSIYKSEHSPVRTQLFWIEAKSIPLFISTHLLRHHVGSVPFQLTCRDDRDGGNPGFIEKISNIVTCLQKADGYSMEGDWMAAHHLITQVSLELLDLQYSADRYTPVNLGLLVNAQSLIDMAKLRRCKQSHAETIAVFQLIKAEIAKIDPALAAMMVPKCIYRNGLCGEPRCCGYNNTKQFQIDLKQYLVNFTKKQQGINTIHESTTSKKSVTDES